MKSAIFLILAVGFCSIIPAKAGLSDVEISATRRKLDEDRSRGSNITTTTKEIVYDVTVQSKTFKPQANLEVKYMIFFEDAKAGSAEDASVKAERGSEKIATLEGNRAYSFQTKPIKLQTQELDAGWYYSSGGSNRSKDKVSGIWFRVYREGTMIAEYANPSTVSKRETWKD